MTIQIPKLPVSSSGHVSPFIRLFDEAGVPWRTHYHRAGLPSAPEETDYIPTMAFARFVASVCMKAGIDDIGLRIPAQSASSAIHPNVRERLVAAETLADALRAICRLCHFQGTHFRIATRIVGRDIWICHQGSIPAKLVGVEQFEWFRIARIVEIIRRYLGASWNPAYLHVATPCPASLRMAALVGGCEIHSGRDFGVIPIPIDELAASEARAGTVELTPREPDTDWLRNLELVLPAYVGDRRVDLPFFADMIGMSARSLQRALASHATSFAVLYGEAKYQRARQLLLNTTLPLREIALACGFTDKSNFSRFVRRMSGSSPDHIRLFGAK